MDPDEPDTPPEGERPADALPDDPTTARESVEQVLIDDEASEAGSEVGDEMP